MKKMFFGFLLLSLLPTALFSGYTKDDAFKATLSILEENGYTAKIDDLGVVIGEKDQDGFIIQQTVRLTKKGEKNEYAVSVTSRLPDLNKYTPEQKDLAQKTAKEQLKAIDRLINKRFDYFNALEKYVKSHYGLSPETIEAMKTQELAVGLTMDQASFIMKEKYYRYQSLQTVSTLLTGLANVFDALGGGRGNRYQAQEFDNDVHCKTSKIVDEKNPDKKITLAYYYYRDPKSNQSFWLNGHYVDVKNYNAEAGETPIAKLYFEDNKLVKWEDLLMSN
jgi:hypothetical protein